MTTYADDFNRSNSTTTMGSTSTGGAAWVPVSGTWGIDTNKGYLAAASGAGISFVTVDAGAADVVMSAVITGSSYNGMVFRASDANNLIAVEVVPGSSYAPVIFKRVGGSQSTVASGSAITFASGDTLSVELSGSSIVVKRNGTTIVSATDSSLLTNTKHGFYSYNTSGVAGLGRFDNFTISGGSTTIDLTSPTATATAASAPATIALAALLLTSPTAGATAAASPATVAMGALPVTSPTATATAAASPASLSFGTIDLTSPTAAATASASPAALVVGGIALTSPTAEATAGAEPATVVLGDIDVTSPTAVATAASSPATVSVDVNINITSPTATAGASAAPATISGADVEGWGTELTGRALLGIRTTPTDLHLPPVPVDPPPAVASVVLRRNSHQMPALSSVKRKYAVGEYPIVSEPAGTPHVWVDGIDRTWHQDGELVDIDDLISEKGFGDRSATARINTMQIWDRPGFGIWDWLDVAHKVEVGLIRPDGSRHIWWAGDLISDDADSTSSPNGATFETGWLAQGPMVQLTQAQHQPADRMDETDIGIVIAREVNAVISRRYPKVKPVITGITTTKLGSIRESVAERVRDLFSTAWVGNRQWGLVRSETNPRQYVIALTDTTTVHWTVTAGALGVTASLSRDWSQVVNCVYGSGSLANGHRWMNRRYPYLLPYKPPGYFSGDTSDELLLGSTDADTINNGVSLYTQRLRELGYRVPLSSVMLAVHVSATRNLQAQRGLTVDGRVGGQTWSSVWSIGATGANLRSVRLPLAVDPRVEPWLYLPNGDIAEPNPAYIPGHPRIEVDLDYGENTTLKQGIADAQQRVNRLKNPADVGTITLTTCPWEGTRWEIRPGQNLLLKGWRGRDVLLHVADVRINRKAGSVTLTVDSAFRDALTVNEVRKRNAESKADPARKPGAIGRTRSGSAPDMTTPFDGESPAGIVPELTIRGGKWTVWPVAVDKVGTLAKITARTYDPVTKFGILLFGREVMPNQLNAGVGNILAQSRPWASDHVEAFLDRFGFIDGWGQDGQACGFYPGSEQEDDPLTGRFVATSGVNYISERPPFVWFAVLAAHDCRITAELDPKSWL